MLFRAKRSKYEPNKIAGRNRMFSPLGIETKLIENLLAPVGLDDDELHFNKRPEYA